MPVPAIIDAYAVRQDLIYIGPENLAWLFSVGRDSINSPTYSQSLPIFRSWTLLSSELQVSCR